MEADLVFGLSQKVKLEDLLAYKRERFVTNQSDLVKYHNHPFVILRSLNEGEVDWEVAPMFRIRFEDGFETDAFVEEIFHESLLERMRELKTT